MKLSSLLAVAAVATVAGIAAGIYFILSEIGAEKVWQLIMIAVLAGLGIGFVRVLFTGLAKLAEARKITPPEKHIERTVHTIDARPQAPPALPAPWSPEPNMAIFPAMIGAAWRQGIDQAGQSQSAGEVIDGEAKPAVPARRVWQ